MTFKEKRKFVNSYDIEALNAAVKHFEENFDEADQAGWWPTRIEIWNEILGAPAGWVHWHGDGFWAIEPVMHDFPEEF